MRKLTEVVITADPGVTVKTTRRVGNTSKQIFITVNQQDTVNLVTRGIIPPLGLLWSEVFASATAGDDIVIGTGDTIIFDMTQTPVYGDIIVNGTIQVLRTRNTELRFDGMMVSATGVYEAGTEANPFPRTYVHRITPSGLRANDPSVAMPSAATGSMNRGLMVSAGGRLSLVATVPDVVIFKLGATAEIGATSLTAAVPVTLKAGDMLELGTTMYWQEGMSDLTAVMGGNDGTDATEYGRRAGYGRELVTVSSDVNNSTTIPLTAGLVFRHYGLLQYLVPPNLETAVGTNLSTTSYTIQAGDSFGSVNGVTITGTKVLAALAAGASNTIDNRATVGLLTHPIKFGAPLDSDWTTHGYGAHLMVMGLSSRCQMQGVERNRVGQAGFLGRYPDHQHMRSYQAYTGGVTSPVSGTYLGDVDPAYNYIKRCSMRDSSNRGSTLHGVCAFNLYQNVYSSTDTHCIFLEDGSEERNVIDGNFVSGIGAIGYGKTALKAHDNINHNGASASGPSGIWYTNPSNYLRNNIVVGSYIGIWNSFSTACFGASRDVAIAPLNKAPLQWLNNESGCARFESMRSNFVVVDEAGNINLGTGWVGNGVDKNRIEGANLWKSGSAWYENRAFRVEYVNWKTAGLKGANLYVGEHELGIFGVAVGDFIGGRFYTRTLDDYYSADRPQQQTSYHNDIHRKDCIFVPAPMDGGIARYGLNRIMQKGGTMPLWDYYENPVENQFTLDTNTCFLGSDPGYPGVMFPAPFLLAGQFSAAYRTALGNPTFSTPDSRQNAGAKKLPADGSMFGQAGGWWVFDEPFLTYGTSGGVYAQAPAGLTNLNGLLLSSSYNFIGLWAHEASGVEVSGQDTGSMENSKPINYTRLQEDGVTVVSTWNTGAPDGNYPNKRHASTLDGAVIDTSWAREDVPLPTSLRIEVWGMTYSGANMTWALDWNGATAVSVCYMYPRGGPAVSFASAANKAELLAATDRRYWADTTNNKIWLRIFGGLTHNLPEETTPSYITHNPCTIAVNQ